jgi:hypothetical protein
MYFHAMCGEPDQAADWAEKAIEQRHPMVPALLRTYSGKVLRSSPRWPSLLRILNLPEVGP